MSKERYNQIIDEAYESYREKNHILYKDTAWTKEEFINKCKTDPEFSEKWGLKIQERELSLEERAKWLQDNKGYDLLVGNLEHDHIREVVEDEAPTKLITTKYQNETIESYE
jgi:hypothetical protein